MNEMVFYSMGQFVYEEILLNGTQFVTRYGRQSLSALNIHYEQYSLISLREAIEKIRDAARKPVEVITEELFDDQLEIIPPVDCCATHDSQTFKLAELFKQDITEIYAYYRGCFFRFRNRRDMTHREIIARIESDYFAVAKQNVSFAESD